MLEAMKSSISYYYSVDDYATNAEVIKNHSLRLAGIVKESSVVRDLEKVDLRFTLAGTNNEIPVSYKGSIPDNFVEEGEVVVEGRVDTNGIFQADILMTKCESKYKAKVKQ
jgi:cytochrome c-type biogenesis protein CcmE